MAALRERLMELMWTTTETAPSGSHACFNWSGNTPRSPIGDSKSNFSIRALRLTRSPLAERPRRECGNERTTVFQFVIRGADAPGGTRTLIFHGRGEGIVRSLGGQALRERLARRIGTHGRPAS